MDETHLIFLYHIMVILIILGTAIVTLGGVVRVGPFKNMNERITKVLVGALVLELCAAFIGVFKTLPQLEFYRAQEYRWVIKYNDFLQEWESNLPDDKKEILIFFQENKGQHARCLAAFYGFRDLVKQYEILCRTSDRMNIESWKKNMDRLEEKYISFFKQNMNAEYSRLDNIQELLEKHERYLESSGKVGSGTMYVSFKGENYQGVVTYRFPGVKTYTVLTCEGYKKKDTLELEFYQAPSALAVDNFYIPRPEGHFKMNFIEDRSHPGHYTGILPNNLGDIHIQEK